MWKTGPVKPAVKPRHPCKGQFGRIQVGFESEFSNILDKPEGRKTILQGEYGTEIPAQPCLKLFKAHGAKSNVAKFIFKTHPLVPCSIRKMIFKLFGSSKILLNF